MIEREIDCPFCGETITVLVDTSVDEQDYIEDCQVCCKPIHFVVKCEEGSIVRLEADSD